MALLAAASVSRVETTLSTLLAARTPLPAARLAPAQASFVGRVGQVARRLQADVGLPPSLITAMAINETGWGSSELSNRVNNYFGIKADVGQGTVGSTVFDTREVIDGRAVVVRAPFRAYRSLDESVQDLGRFLHTNSRYDDVWKRADDPRASALALARAGYATDPEWAPKLIGLIDSFGLDALDGPGWMPDWLLASWSK